MIMATTIHLRGRALMKIYPYLLLTGAENPDFQGTMLPAILLKETPLPRFLFLNSFCRYR